VAEHIVAIREVRNGRSNRSGGVIWAFKIEDPRSSAVEGIEELSNEGRSLPASRDPQGTS
jgi:hypothetical protein